MCVCARVYVSRSFLRLLTPVQGHVLHVGGLSSAFPRGNHEGGTKGAVVVAASMGSVPYGHPLPHEEPGLASL